MTPIAVCEGVELEWESSRLAGNVVQLVWIENEPLGGQTQADFAEQARLPQGAGSVAQETGRTVVNLIWALPP